MTLAYRTVARDVSTDARAGEITLERGRIATPAFMPVGTLGTVKGLEPDDLHRMQARIILGNTYHLYLRPGLEVLERMGGLHRFMGWSGPVLTDSGGFQFFSLARFARVTDDGVEFRSHLDGSRHRFSPEGVIDIQRVIGSDIRMVLDDCPALPATPARLDESLRRSSVWAHRSLVAGRGLGGATFGIVQGGTDVARRISHLETLAAMEVDGRAFEGLALGGLAVGEAPELTWATLAEVGPRMPSDRPRYLMGVGKPADLLRAVASGIDMFDCVLPTRNARTAQVFTREGPLNLRNARYRMDDTPIDPTCACPVCTRFSRAYVAHLFRAGEMLGPRLASLHNLHYYLGLMREAREAIVAGRYGVWMRETMAAWA